MSQNTGSFWKIGLPALALMWLVCWAFFGESKEDYFTKLSRHPLHFGLRVDGGSPCFYFECPEESLFLDVEFHGRLEILNPPGNNQYLVVLKEDSLGALKKLRGPIKFEGYLIGGTYVVESRDVDTDTLKYKQRFRATPISSFAEI